MQLMYLQIKKPKNGRIKIFRDKEATRKVPLIFLNDKMLKETTQRSI